MPKVSIPGATLGATVLCSVTFRNNTIGLAGLNNSSSSFSDMYTYCFAVSKDPAMTAKGFLGRPLRWRKICTAFSCKASHTK